MNLNKTNFKRMLSEEASAGTGKTFALSVRYVCLLLMGVNPRNIWALTFTNKAADEMESRVMSIVSNPKMHLNELDAISYILKIKQNTVYQKLLKIRKSFSSEENHIVTIDSFTNQILRNFATNLGIPSDFNIGDINPYEKALEFYKFVKERKETNMLFEFSESTNKKLDAIIELFNEFEGYHNELALPLSTLAIEATVNDYSSMVNISIDTIKTKLDNMLDFLISNNAGKSMISPFSDFTSVEELVEKSVFSRESLNYKTFAKVYSPVLDDLFIDLKNSISEYFFLKEKAFLVNSAYLYMYFNSVSMEVRQENKLMTFNDVAKIVFDVMQSKSNDAEYIKFKLDSKIDHLLIDEFQDTSWVQYKILEPIIDEIAASQDFKSFFYVGDIKQSIYRFRGGNSALFGIVKNKYNMETETLNVNYRSSTSVVEFTNNIFSKIYNNYVMQEPRKNAVSGYVDVKIAIDSVKEAAEYAVNMVDSGVEQKDIAILVYTNDEVLQISNAINDLNKDIKISTETNSKLINNRVVQSCVDALKYMFYGDDFYFYSYLGMIGQLENDEDVYRLKFEHIFTDAVSLSDFPGMYVKFVTEKLGLLTNDNVIKFIEIANKYQSIEEFISNIDLLQEPVVNTENSDGVRVITMHKAKGLEFENVIVVDKQELIPGGNNPVFFDFDENGDISRIWKRTSKRNFFDQEYANALQDEKNRELNDAFNVAYVAFTRAKFKLTVFAYPSKSKLSNISGLLEHSAEFVIEENQNEQ